MFHRSVSKTYLRTTLTLFTLFLLTRPTISLAACDKETIQFYLDKGFSQEQITELCTQQAGEDEKPAYQPYEKPVVIYQEGVKPGYSREEQQAEKILGGGLNARAITITPEKINYIRAVCLTAGYGPEEHQRAKDCFEVAFSVKRKNLVVRDSGKRLLILGEKQITIEGDIQRKFVREDPFGGYSPEIRLMFENKYEAAESGNTTKLPVRRGESVAQMISALRTLALTADESNANTDIVEKILADDYVAPQDRESDPAQNETEEKKGKWWNPFD